MFLERKTKCYGLNGSLGGKMQSQFILNKPFQMEVRVFDLSTMSFEQLSQLEVDVKNEKQRRRAQEEDALLREIREKLSALGLSADDIAKRLGGGKSSAGKPKLPGVYRDPNNAENTWSGRGRKPLWVLAWLKQGRSLDELAI